MIVRISIFDTIINLYKPYIMDNCIKIVSKIQFLTFCGGIKIKKELNLSDLALYLCCLRRTTRIACMGMGSWTRVPDRRTFHSRNAHRASRMVPP